MPRVKESEHPLFDQALNGDISAATLFEEAHHLLKISNTEQTHAFLELGHLPSVNQAISHADKINEWFSLLLQLIQTSTYDVGTLLKQRAERYTEKALFQTIHGDSINKFSFIQVRNAVNVIAGSLMNDKSNNSLTVGILAPNSIRGALVDLACLSTISVLCLSLLIFPQTT